MAKYTEYKYQQLIRSSMIFFSAIIFLAIFNYALNQMDQEIELGYTKGKIIDVYEKKDLITTRNYVKFEIDGKELVESISNKEYILFKDMTNEDVFIIFTKKNKNYEKVAVDEIDLNNYKKEHKNIEEMPYW